MTASAKAPVHNSGHDSHVHAHAEAHHEHPSHESGVETVEDPVCGMTVALGMGKPSAAHAGEMYHFCSMKCLDKFVADPASYLHSEQ